MSSQTPPRTTTTDREQRTETVASADATDYLDVLDTRYTREIVEAIRSEPRPASELVEASSASRPTVYRRLNSLEEAGLIESDTRIGVDGHHFTVFRACLETITVDIDADGLSVTVSMERGPQTSGGEPGGISGD